MGVRHSSDRVTACQTQFSFGKNPSAHRRLHNIVPIFGRMLPWNSVQARLLRSSWPMFGEYLDLMRRFSAWLPTYDAPNFRRTFRGPWKDIIVHNYARAMSTRSESPRTDVASCSRNISSQLSPQQWSQSIAANGTCRGQSTGSSQVGNILNTAQMYQHFSPRVGSHINSLGLTNGQ